MAAGWKGDDVAAPMADSVRMLSVNDGELVPAASLKCSGCSRQLNAADAFFRPMQLRGTAAGAPAAAPAGAPAADAAPTDAAAAPTAKIFCSGCRDSHLGPLCRGCGKPAPRKDAIVAADAWWHKRCLRCSHPGCGLALGEQYYLFESNVCCLEHYLQRTSEPCGACGMPVGSGISALGRSWHHGCLKCVVSGKPITLGGDEEAVLEGNADFYLHQGQAVSPSEFERGSPLCAVCGKPAPSDRVYARGRFMHTGCFKCAHCGQLIGNRRFVEFDGEPYLEGCYHKLFGASAAPEMKHFSRRELKSYAISISLNQAELGGPNGVRRFAEAHAKLLREVAPRLRELGVVELRCFHFAPKPVLMLSFAVNDESDPRELFATLGTQPGCEEWDRMLADAVEVRRVGGELVKWYDTLAADALAIRPQADNAAIA